MQYFIILFLIFIVLLIGGVLAYVFRNKVAQTFIIPLSQFMAIHVFSLMFEFKVEATVRTQMMRTTNKYGDTDRQGQVITDAWDSAQQNVSVMCGFTLYKYTRHYLYQP